MNAPERVELRGRILAELRGQFVVPTKREMDKLLASYFMHGKNEAAFHYELQRLIQSRRESENSDLHPVKSDA